LNPRKEKIKEFQKKKYRAIRESPEKEREKASEIRTGKQKQET